MNNQALFIRHPDEIPLDLQVVELPVTPAESTMPLGLVCKSPAMLACGQLVSISATELINDLDITGQIEWCCAHDDHYELRILFSTDEYAQRMRMFEQVCHIHSYRRWVRNQQGRTLSDDEAALEWIAKYAALFPSNNL
jgi:hypothetical protein